MKAPKIQRIGKKIPKKNIHPCPFLSVITPERERHDQVQEDAANSDCPPHDCLLSE